MHRTHQLQFFLKESLAVNDILGCAITKQEILLWRPPLLFRLWNVLQTLITITIEVVSESEGLFRYQRRYLPGLILSEVSNELLCLLPVVGIKHTFAAGSDAARKLGKVASGWHGRRFQATQFIFNR